MEKTMSLLPFEVSEKPFSARFVLILQAGGKKFLLFKPWFRWCSWVDCCSVHISYLLKPKSHICCETSTN